MFPAGNAAALARCAFGFEETALAIATPVFIQLLAFLHRSNTPDQSLPRRTDIFITFADILKVPFIKQTFA